MSFMVPSGVIIVGVCTTMFIAIISFALYAQPQQRTQPRFCFSEEDIARIRTLSQEAMDTAFKLHLEGLFDTWLRGATDPTARARARNGAQLGLAAYAMAREDTKKWKPELC